MTKLTRIATPLIAVAMMTVPMMAPAQSSQQVNAKQIHGKFRGPYEDGILSARIDAAANRSMDPKQSYLYVSPPVKEEAREAYRVAFMIGYKTAVASERPRRVSLGE